MADRWHRMTLNPAGRWLERDGKVVGSVMPSFAREGLWCADVPGILETYFPTRSAAMRAVMVEAASNKRCGAAG